MKDDELFLEMNELKSSGGDFISARNKIVLKYSRLVKFLASRWLRKYLKEYKNYFNDLVQAGNVGLIKSVERFNSKNGASFITYAYDNIEAHIINAWLKDNFSEIKIPERIIWERIRYSRIKNELAYKFGRNPTLFEISQVMEISEEYLSKMLYDYRFIDFLDKPIFDKDGDGKSHLHDFVADTNNFCPIATIEINQSASLIFKILKSKLTEEEFQIVSLIDGIGTGIQMDFQAVARKLSKRREIIRQIYRRALRKLKPHLKEFND